MPNLTVEPPSLEESVTPLLDEKVEVPCESVYHEGGKFHDGPGVYWIIFHHTCDEELGLTLRCKLWYDTAVGLFTRIGRSRCHDCGFVGTQADFFTVIGMAE